ncbi:hypothetical protein HYH03_009497 [Edaphochlamys debaryana]|uniref:CRM domain-containing protein n=1 Tax=Edaphochlamys debaryana TaxID=47281 RepID=A0A835XY01_9CHLO|nr:hypothetical protein HYH03_009497 [Edaphochlamys debaryana]|eukprot:KAG2492256.1 hypothetical protein HYH03_009497 [Edaphochlamys debaryana]
MRIAGAAKPAAAASTSAPVGGRRPSQPRSGAPPRAANPATLQQPEEMEQAAAAAAALKQAQAWDQGQTEGDADPTGPSAPQPVPFGDVGGPDGEFSFVQVGRPVRARLPTNPSSAASPPPPRSTPHAAAGPAAASSSSSQATNDDSDDDDSAVSQERIPMLRPDERQQPPLHPRAARQLWRAAEQLAAAGQLVRLPVGRAGLSRALLAQAGELLERHELLRLNLLPSCSLEPQFVAWVAEGALDCAVVGVKGRTATLFREHGLPRPPASLRSEEGADVLATGLGTTPAASGGSGPNESAAAAAGPAGSGVEVFVADKGDSRGVGALRVPAHGAGTEAVAGGAEADAGAAAAGLGERRSAEARGPAAAGEGGRPQTEGEGGGDGERGQGAGEADALASKEAAAARWRRAWGARRSVRVRLPL